MQPNILCEPTLCLWNRFIGSHRVTSFKGRLWMRVRWWQFGSKGKDISQHTAA